MKHDGKSRKIVTHDINGRKLSPSQSAVITEMMNNLDRNMIANEQDAA